MNTDEHRFVSVFRHFYCNFLRAFLKCYKGEICPDEDDSVRAWNQFSAGILSELELLLMTLAEKLWTGDATFGTKATITRRMGLRYQYVQLLCQHFVDQYHSPKERYDEGQLLLNRLLDYNPFRSGTSDGRDREGQAETEELADLLKDDLQDFRLQVLWTAESCRFRFLVATESMQDLVSAKPEFWRTDEFKGLLREVCLPSRGLELLHRCKEQFAWAMDEDLLGSLNSIFGEHNPRTCWVATTLEDVKKSPSEDDRTRKMLQSIQHRRKRLFATYGPESTPEREPSSTMPASAN